MRILYASDLHLEFHRNSCPDPPDPVTYDVVVLAGDVNLGAYGVAWAMDLFGPTGKPVIYVPGNHEYYRYDYDRNNAAMKALEQLDANLHVMLPGTLVVDRTRFVGATLWSDLSDPNVRPELAWHKLAYLVNNISDFDLIGRGRKRWSARDCIAEHERHRAFIEEQLAVPFDGATVVVTHFMPTYQAVAKKYENSNLNGYFASELDDVMAEFEPDAWIFGHTHSKQVLQHNRSRTILACNPLGYPGENDERTWEILELG